MNENEKKSPLTAISLIVLGIAIFAAGGVLIYQFTKNDNVQKNAQKVQNKKEEEIVNNLDGLKTEKSKSTRHPLAVMVENHPDSRPQTGLDKASIVYEAITEGGITRFVAVYGPKDASKIGPVRSSRTYFIDWVKEFNAFYSHVGGNLDALNKIKQDSVLDLDEFALAEKAYWRDPKPGQALEHTMYTSTDKLYRAAKDKGWMINDADFAAFKFKQPLTSEKRPDSQQIDINFSTSSYDVSWEYDKDSNQYLRSMAGRVHKDAVSGLQLSSSTVIVQSVKRSEAPVTDVGETGWQMETIGNGKAMVFSEGEQINATWQKDSQNSRTLFYYADGENKGDEIKFIPGHFWIEITPPDVFLDITVK